MGRHFSCLQFLSKEMWCLHKSSAPLWGWVGEVLQCSLTTSAPYGQGTVLGRGKKPIVLDFWDFLSANQWPNNLYNQFFTYALLPLQEPYIGEKQDDEYLEDYWPTTFTTETGHSTTVSGQQGDGFALSWLPTITQTEIPVACHGDLP